MFTWVRLILFLDMNKKACQQTMEPLDVQRSHRIFILEGQSGNCAVITAYGSEMPHDYSTGLHEINIGMFFAFHTQIILQ